jgi:hypothetical protein
MAYHDEWEDPRNYGGEFRGRPGGRTVPFSSGTGPFAGGGLPGFPPASLTGFHGGEYMVGGYPGVYGGAFPPFGDMVDSGGVVVGPSGHPGRYRPRFRTGRYSGVGPRSYRRSDARILEDVNERLTWDPELDATDVEVSVDEGVVTLEGRVENRSAKRRAAYIAESCTGVVDVRNKLKKD